VSPRIANVNNAVTNSRPTESACAPRPGYEPAAINVGLDFGTYSTKILIRPRGEEKAELVQIEPSTEGYPWFASPSVVRVVDNTVFFGGLALEKSGGFLYRSLKVRLLESIKQTAPTDSKCHGGITPDVFVAGYLSWVLRASNTRSTRAIGTVHQESSSTWPRR